MLPTENRLFSDFDFKRIRRFGKGYSNQFFSFFVLNDRKHPDNPSKFGFVVSTKVSKRATKRNRVKRILRDEVYKLLPSIEPGVWAAFWVRARALDASPDKLRLKVKEALKKAQVLKPL